MSGRVAWGRYEGNDVEAVVAMLLNREHPDSIRITPSKGDGGVDILDAGAAGDGGDVVYQVKRYTSPLNSTQKTKVERSLTRLLDPEHGDPRWQHLKVTEWRLVTLGTLRRRPTCGSRISQRTSVSGPIGTA